MNSSSSPGTSGNGPSGAPRRSRQSRFACSMRASRAGHEVPPDVPRLGEAIAGEQNEAARGLGAQVRAVPGPRAKEQHVPARTALSAADQLAVDDVRAAIAGVVGQLDRRTRLHRDVDVGQPRERLDRRAPAERLAHQHADLDAWLAQRRQRAGRVVMKLRRRLLVGARQAHPQLDAVDRRAGGAQRGTGAFRVNDAAPRGHPVDVAGDDRLVRSQVVAVDDLAREQIRHGRQVDVRVGADVHALARREARRSEVIEEHERPDGAVARGGQQATDDEPAEIAVARRQDRFDLGLDRLGDRGLLRIGGRTPAHARRTSPSSHRASTDRSGRPIRPAHRRNSAIRPTIVRLIL